MSDSCKCQGEEGAVKKLHSTTYAGFRGGLVGGEVWVVQFYISTFTVLAVNFSWIGFIISKPTRLLYNPSV